MGGGLMQLVAYGAQDIYLTGNPQITFFKVVYRRHTNFSMECIKQSFKGTVGAGNRVVATLARNGDLVHDCFLKFTAAGSSGQYYVNPGHIVIDNIECEIGGQLIDKHYGHWMEAHTLLTEDSFSPNLGNGDAANGAFTYAGQADGCKLTSHQLLSGTGSVLMAAHFVTGNILFVPLRFWFCRHVGLSLPLIALQYHEVNINVTFSGGSYGAYPYSGTSLWCNYIYLDTDERRRFAQVSHEYLIEQVQYQSFTPVDGSNTFKLNFNHPVKELVWGMLVNTWGGDAANGEFVASGGTAGATFQLKLNGHDRFEKQNAEYFTRYQIYKYHNTRVVGTADKKDVLSVYSFALKPEEHQPSGTCNFSRIDNAQLIGTLMTASKPFNIYAVNYNVLRIMSGMGGLAYSN